MDTTINETLDKQETVEEQQAQKSSVRRDKAHEKAKLDRTFMAKPSNVNAKWWLVDATDKKVGRLASDIAVYLMGKHRPEYTPHIDTGDYVIVTNVDKVVFTGKKWENKKYTYYTGFPRLRSITAAERLEKHPEMILREAVRRMLPKNKLAVKMLEKLKLYTSSTSHPHQAQCPEQIDLGN